MSGEGKIDEKKIGDEKFAEAEEQEKKDEVYEHLFALIQSSGERKRFYTMRMQRLEKAQSSLKNFRLHSRMEEKDDIADNFDKALESLEVTEERLNSLNRDAKQLKDLFLKERKLRLAAEKKNNALAKENQVLLAKVQPSQELPQNVIDHVIEKLVQLKADLNDKQNNVKEE